MKLLMLLRRQKQNIYTGFQESRPNIKVYYIKFRNWANELKGRSKSALHTTQFAI